MSHLHHKVSALIDGELSPGARARALRHARDCDQCRREIAETLEVKQRLTQLPPADVSFALRETVACGAVAPAPPGPGLRPAIRRIAVSLGSMSAFVLALAYIAGGSELNQAGAVRPPVNEFAAEFTDTTGLAPLSDPPVDTLTSASTATTPISFGRPRRVTSTGSPQVKVTAPGSSPTASASDTAALAGLRRAVAAPDRIAFKGVWLCHSYDGGRTESFAVAVRHVPGQGTTYDMLGGNSAADQTLFIGAPSASAVTAADQAIGRMAAEYELSLGGSHQVLGRPARVVTATQAGELRARFWIDDATGLLLRRDLYADGRLVRSSGFTSLKMLRHGFMGALPPELPVPPSRRVSTRIAAVLTDQGWTYPARLGGIFRLSALRRVGLAGGVMRADYTDGLSTLSVFEERGTLDAASLPGFRRVTFGGRVFYVREGLPMTVVWQSGSTVFTVVTDLPEPMTAALVARFPSQGQSTSDGSGQSVADRVGRGLSRLVSDVAP